MPITECKHILNNEPRNIILALKKNIVDKVQKIVACFYHCFKPIFIKWAMIMYKAYPEDLINFIADTAFTDCILKLQEKAGLGELYNDRACIKTILFYFYKNTLREKLQQEKRKIQKDRGFEAEYVRNEIFIENENTYNEKRFASLEKALDRLEAKDREIIIWRHVEEKSNAEIANLLGIATPSATNRIYRCMQRLKDLIDK